MLGFSSFGSFLGAIGLISYFFSLIESPPSLKMGKCPRHKKGVHRSVARRHDSYHVGRNGKALSACGAQEPLKRNVPLFPSER